MVMAGARVEAGARLARFGLDAGEEVVQAGHDGAEAPVEQKADRAGETGRGVAHRHDRGGDGFPQSPDEAREAGEEGLRCRVHAGVRA